MVVSELILQGLILSDLLYELVVSKSKIVMVLYHVVLKLLVLVPLVE